MPDNRKNVQVRQPGIAGYENADKNGWPEPLADGSQTVKVTVTNGKNGQQTNFRPMKTSGQD